MMQILKKSKVFVLLIISLLLNSCYYFFIPYKDFAQKSLVQNNLNSQTFLKQVVIEELLNLVFDNQTKKEQYIQEQLQDNPAKKNSIKAALAYFSVPTNLSYEFGARPIDVEKSQKVVEAFWQNDWLYFLFHYAQFEFFATAPAVINTGNNFYSRFANRLDWNLQAQSNKILDFAMVETPAKYYDDYAKTTDLKNWPNKHIVFYLKMANNSIVRLDYFKQRSKHDQNMWQIKVKINPQVYVLEYIQTKVVNDFNIHDYARYVHKINSSTDAIDELKDDLETFYTSRFGENVPYNFKRMH